MKFVKIASCLLAVLPLAACNQSPTAPAQVALPVAAPSMLTQANLDKVQPDMSPAMVKNLLGDPTESKTEPIPVVGGSQTTYTYRNTTSEVKIVFKNDQMKEKTGSFGQ